MKTEDRMLHEGLFLDAMSKEGYIPAPFLGLEVQLSRCRHMHLGAL